MSSLILAMIVCQVIASEPAKIYFSQKDVIKECKITNVERKVCLNQCTNCIPVIWNDRCDYRCDKPMSAPLEPKKAKK